VKTTFKPSSHDFRHHRRSRCHPRIKLIVTFKIISTIYNNSHRLSYIHAHCTAIYPTIVNNTLQWPSPITQLTKHRPLCDSFSEYSEC